MPLSKKRNKERMRESRATCVQPKPLGTEVFMGNDRKIKALADGVRRIVQPIPNCPDGRYRDV